MASNFAQPANRRNSRLSVCYWTYGSPPDLFKVELEAWTESRREGGGFQVSYRFEARVHLVTLGGETKFLVSVPLPDDERVRDQLAKGQDPLLALFKDDGHQTMTMLGPQGAGLGALYERLVLGTATLDTGISVQGPRL